jgi:hypothetical protein
MEFHKWLSLASIAGWVGVIGKFIIFNWGVIPAVVVTPIFFWISAKKLDII